jgi:hypothetical protein
MFDMSKVAFGEDKIFFNPILFADEFLLKSRWHCGPGVLCQVMQPKPRQGEYFVAKNAHRSDICVFCESPDLIW